MKQIYELSPEELDQIPSYLSGLPKQQPHRAKALAAWRDWYDRGSPLPPPRLDNFGPTFTDLQRSDTLAWEWAKRRELRGY